MGWVGERAQVRAWLQRKVLNADVINGAQFPLARSGSQVDVLPVGVAVAGCASMSRRALQSALLARLPQLAKIMYALGNIDCYRDSLTQ